MLQQKVLAMLLAETGKCEQRCEDHTNRIGRARPDANDAVRRLEHVAAAGDLERRVLVGDNHGRLERAQVLVGTPHLGHLDARALELARVQLHLSEARHIHGHHGQ
jgi:hypothetical protein